MLIVCAANAFGQVQSPTLGWSPPGTVVDIDFRDNRSFDWRSGVGTTCLFTNGAYAAGGVAKFNPVGFTAFTNVGVRISPPTSPNYFTNRNYTVFMTLYQTNVSGIVDLLVASTGAARSYFAQKYSDNILYIDNFGAQPAVTNITTVSEWYGRWNVLAYNNLNGTNRFYFNGTIMNPLIVGSGSPAYFMLGSNPDVERIGSQIKGYAGRTAFVSGILTPTEIKDISVKILAETERIP